MLSQDADELLRELVEAVAADTDPIGSADIDRWQAIDLVSTLSRETGVQFAQTGGRGSAASIFLRGAGSS